jgi:nitric oxide synthase oxygenase domain/subunit
MTQDDKIAKNAKEFMKTAGWGKRSFTTLQVTRLLKLFAQEQVKLFAIPDVSNNEVAVCDSCDFESEGNGWFKCKKCGYSYAR